MAKLHTGFFSWEILRNALMRNGAYGSQLGKVRSKIKGNALTLNQRVQGSSPCAPTNTCLAPADK